VICLSVSRNVDSSCH
ncbi:hypothetical protein D046_6734B, partial [Vibrio parahaemolyticus V-223/04]